MKSTKLIASIWLFYIYTICSTIIQQSYNNNSVRGKDNMLSEQNPE